MNASVVRLIVAAALVVVVAVVAAYLRRRRADQPPTQAGEWSVPSQLDRRDFAGTDRPWLVVVFTSATCDACQAMVTKAAVLASDAVAVEEVEYRADPERHRRYRIEAVPTTLIADDRGVVRISYLGPVSATDLWADVARLRAPDGEPG